VLVGARCVRLGDTECGFGGGGEGVPVTVEAIGGGLVDSGVVVEVSPVQATARSRTSRDPVRTNRCIDIGALADWSRSVIDSIVRMWQFKGDKVP
jgi:hypothetical protein